MENCVVALYGTEFYYENSMKQFIFKLNRYLFNGLQSVRLYKNETLLMSNQRKFNPNFYYFQRCVNKC